jgi:UDP-N-acetylmuramoyl-L-alanyl-D-glutamate--2,6-diaminopimelate ligase
MQQPVNLTTLLRRLPPSTIVEGDTARAIACIEIDSRAVRPGALFVALRGGHADGHAFVTQAIANGAVAVVVEANEPLAPSDATVVRVDESRRALSIIAAAFYGDPSSALDVIGVTGTNGKTTTTQMIAAILNEAARACGVIGTVGAALGTRAWKVSNTTPLPPELHRLLAAMRDEGATAVAMEVSSHALALERVEDVTFRIAVLTNVARDHLDFHHTLESYAQTKYKLFTLARTCVINVDDAYGARWAAERSASGAQVVTYGRENAARIVPTAIAVTADGSRFTIDGHPYDLRIPGRFNVWNAAAAIGVARSLGIDDDVSARGLAGLTQIRGRMEHVRAGGVEVIVDYAHTPDALEHALRALRETTTGALAVVFGCGGDRDRGKRPEMGAVAARFADRVYVTSDNPRTEEPGAIAAEIVEGIGKAPWAIELDRRRAIERAIAEAGAGDVVLVAGKGHETYQIFGDHIVDFDDLAVAREALIHRPATP